MKSKIIPVALACLCASAVRAQFNPVPLTQSSYTFSIVLASNVVGPVPNCVDAYVGTGLSFGDSTLYEQGFATPIPNGQGYNSGIPPHGSTFTNINNSDMTFTMPPSYFTNDDLIVYSGIGSGSFTFSTATPATRLALLCTGGNNGCTVNYTVTHETGGSETGSFNPGDWFGGGGTTAWGANGRCEGGGIENYNSSETNNNAPYLYADYLVITNSSPVTGIDFVFSSGGGVDNFFAVSAANGSAVYTPVPVTGFNEMSIVQVLNPFPLTATMDSGTNLNPNINGGEGNYGLGNTFYEQGYDTNNPTTGLPPSGASFTSFSQPTHTYLMGNYATNCAILIDTNHQSENIVPVAPVTCYGVAFLTAGANIGSGEMTNICILQHADGVNETNIFFGYDWFNQTVPGAIAYEANGRVDMDGRTLNDVTNNAGTPYLFETYFPLNDYTSSVTNMIVQYSSAPSASSTTYIMAVSADPNPIPPIITQEPLPTNQTWYASQSASMSVLVSGTLPITNIWLIETNGVYVPLTNGTQPDGSIISGATTTTLTIGNLASDDSTNFEYIATNAAGGAVSAPAAITINPAPPVAPVIDSQIPDVSISTLDVFTNVANKTNLFSLVIDSNSAPPFSYQWYSGLPQSPATAIPGATNATYASVDVAGVTISCIVSNFVGTATSSPVSLVAISPTPYQSVVLSYKPIAYWPLNEVSGTTAFDYAGNNNGTYTGNYQLDQPGIPTTVGFGAGTSVYLNGENTYVDVPVNNLNILGPITLIQWIQTAGEGGNFTSSLGHTDTGYRFDVDGGGIAHFADDGPDVISSNVVTDNNWHQLVGVMNGTNEYLYVDGQLNASHAASLPSGSGDDVYIGGAPDYGNRFYAGNTAQVAILTNALTASQVAALYYSGDFPPTVSISPASPSIYVGDTLTLTATTNGSPLIGLQWYYIDTSNNSNIIAGATNTTYSIDNVPLTLSGYTYGIIAANAYGTNNASVYLEVQNGPPYLPAGGDIAILNAQTYVGAPVTYTVSPTGSQPISYQWLVNGNAVAGATNSSFTAPAGCGSNTIQVAITNAYSDGTPTLSSIATLVALSTPTNITFETNGTGWQLNTAGVGTVPFFGTNTLELTDGLVSGEASSAFYYMAQYVGTFSASFTYTAGGDEAADGVAFVIQDSSSGTNALGEAGGDLGYFQIEPSIALELDLYNAVGIAPGTNGLTYGSLPQGELYGPTGQIKINNGDPISFQLNFENGVMAVFMTDLSTSATYSTNYTFGPLTNLLGGTDLAYVGFTGGDGGDTSIQTISNFSFTSAIPSMMLSLSPLSANSFTLSWLASDPNWQLQESSSLAPSDWIAGPAPTDVNGTNTVTVTVPAGSGSEFYRLQHVGCTPE